MATLLKANGEKRYIKPRRRRFSLEELQKAVGGYVEYVRAGQEHYLVVDEDGRPKGLPFNKNATEILRQFGTAQDIVGDAVFVEKSEII